jgi:hypothetical protein
MTTVCLHVKPTALDPGLALMAVTLLGPRWSGDRLRLERPGEFGLPRGDLVGWSDFYGGGPCRVQVACAANGSDTGYLVWGGTLGLRVVPHDLDQVDRQLGDVLESRSVLWIKDVGALPTEVREVVEVTAAAQPGADRSRSLAGGDPVPGRVGVATSADW